MKYLTWYKPSSGLGIESARSRTLASFSARSLSISGSRPAGSGVA